MRTGAVRLALDGLSAGNHNAKLGVPGFVWHDFSGQRGPMFSVIAASRDPCSQSYPQLNLFPWRAESPTDVQQKVRSQRQIGVVVYVVLGVTASLIVAALIWLPMVRASLRGERSERAGASATPTPVRPSVTVSQSSPGALDMSTDNGVAAAAGFRDSESESLRVTWVKTLHVLPETDYQLAAEHERSVADACEPLPSHEPLEFNHFVPFLTQRDYREYADAVPAMSVRRHIFSVGMDMLDSDKRGLPLLTSRTILRYLQENFVTLQVRLQKEPLTGELFLHHRPLAGMVAYRRPALTQSPTEGLSNTLKNYRSLGLYLGPDVESIPRNLRTLVLLHKSEWDGGIGMSGAKTKYEFVFVRARDRLPEVGGVATDLQLHTFATSSERSILHYLRPGDRPRRPQDCSVKNLLYFTEFVDAGLRPVASVSRGSFYNEVGVFPLVELDNFASAGLDRESDRQPDRSARCDH